MSLDGIGGGVVSQNTLPTDPVTQQILQDGRNVVESFRLIKVRKDMNQSEYAQYKVNWNYFNTVWSYNYAVSTINGTAGRPVTSWWQHVSRTDLNSYSNGQLAHIAAYPSCSTAFYNFS